MDLEHSESQGNLQKIRERTKSVGDVPRQLFLPFSSRFQVSSAFKFHVFLLLSFFLDVCYFTLITPFRFTKLKKKGNTSNGPSTFGIHTNCIQQILSTIVAFTTVIYAFLDLRYWVEQNLRETPQEAFQYASYFIRGFIPLFWCGTFWLKGKWFAKLLVVCQGRKEQVHGLLLGMTAPQQKRNIKPNIKLRVMVTLMIVLTILKVGFLMYWSWSWEDFLVYNSELTFYNLHLQNWTGSKSKAYQEILQDPPLLCVGIVASVFYVWDDYLENMFDLLCFIGAAMVYSVCGHFADEMEKLSRMNSSANSNEFLESKKILKLMQTNYVDLIAILESINEVFGSLIVLYFLRSYPNLVYCVFGLFKKVDMKIAIHYGYKIAIFILVTLTAAEGNSKVGQFKQWLFHTSVAASTSNQQDEEDDFSMIISINECNQKVNEEITQRRSVSGEIDMASLNVLHREVSTERLGLKGYKFFTVTHELIATVS